MPDLKPANDSTAPRETPSAIWPAPKMQMSRLVYSNKDAKLHLRSVLPLALLSAFRAAQETQIEFAIYFLTKVSRYETPSAFPESAKMQVKSALPLS